MAPRVLEHLGERLSEGCRVDYYRLSPSVHAADLPNLPTATPAARLQRFNATRCSRSPAGDAFHHLGSQNRTKHPTSPQASPASSAIRIRCRVEDVAGELVDAPTLARGTCSDALMEVVRYTQEKVPHVGEPARLAAAVGRIYPATTLEAGGIESSYALRDCGS